MLGRTLFKLGHSYVVVVPPAYVRLLGWNQGDAVDVGVRGHEVTITNATQERSKPEGQPRSRSDRRGRSR